MDRNTFKHARFANEVTSTTARGSSFTGYTLNKVVWSGELVDAAKSSMYFLDAVNVKQLAQGEKSIVVPYRKYFVSGATVNFDTTEPTTSDMSQFGTNLIDGVVITPGPYYKAAAITGYAAQGNMRDLVADKMESLSYALADLVDNGVASALAAATQTTSTVAGATTLYGGSANADSALAAGDVLTTELINKAERILSGKYAYYWTGGVHTKSSGVKNPWSNEATDPYVLMIGQSQKEALRNSSQFVNAAEYGSRVVISSGEIGDYLGVRVIVSNNIPEVAASGTALDGGSVPTVDMTRCILMKGRKAYTFVWGRAPKFTPWLDERKDQKGITLICDYAGSIVHADAIVHIDVANA
jgi:N4-gp56 family major capsid protein